MSIISAYSNSQDNLSWVCQPSTSPHPVQHFTSPHPVQLLTSPTPHLTSPHPAQLSESGSCRVQRPERFRTATHDHCLGAPDDRPRSPVGQSVDRTAAGPHMPLAAARHLVCRLPFPVCRLPSARALSVHMFDRMRCQKSMFMQIMLRTVRGLPTPNCAPTVALPRPSPIAGVNILHRCTCNTSLQLPLPCTRGT